MGDILSTVGHYDAVRNALGVTSDIVADSLITSLTYLDLVEGEVKELVADWSDLLTAAGLDAIRLRVGTANWVAARLCGYLERQEGQNYKIADYSHSASAVDWREKAFELSREAAKLFAKISTQTTPTSRPALFTVAGPTRARSNVPATFEEWLDRIEPGVVDWLDDEQVVG